MMRAGLRPRRWCGRGSASTISSASAPAVSPAGTVHSAFAAAVGGSDAGFAAGGGIGGTEDADDTAGGFGKSLEGAPLVAARPGRTQAGEHALAGGEGGVAVRFRRHEDLRRRPGVVPGDGAGEGVAVGVGAGDLDKGDGREMAGRARGAVREGAPVRSGLGAGGAGQWAVLWSEEAALRGDVPGGRIRRENRGGCKRPDRGGGAAPPPGNDPPARKVRRLTWPAGPLRPL